MYLVKSRDSIKIEELSKKCLERKLYIKGRLGKQLFEQSSSLKILSVLFDGVAVGWAMVFFNPALIYDFNTHLGVYVAEEYRGKDLGELLINKTVEKIPYEITVDEQSLAYYSQIPNLNEVLVGNIPKFPYNKRLELFNNLPLTEEIYLEDKV